MQEIKKINLSLKLYNSSYKLGEICLQITDGKHGDCENQENSGYYFVSVKDIDDGEINYSNARQITKFDFEDTDRRTKLENEDILITNSGTIGKFVFVNSPLSRKTTFQKSVAIIKPNKNKIIPKFLYYYLISEKRQLVEYAGGTTQKNLLLRDIRNFEVKIPDESRQKKIIMILNDIDQLISVNKKLNKNIYIALILTFILTGLGSIYAGNTKKGLTLLILRVLFAALAFFSNIFGILSVLVWVYGFYEVYNDVQIANRNSSPNLINDFKNWNQQNKIIAILIICAILILTLNSLISFSSTDSYSPGDSATSNHVSYSYDSYPSHYGGVDTSPDTIAKNDPDSYYDYYEYGDNPDVDDYLESEGYD